MDGCSVAVRQLGRMAPVPMILKDLQYYVSEVEDNWQRVWAWLDSKPGLDGAQLLEQVIVYLNLQFRGHRCQLN